MLDDEPWRRRGRRVRCSPKADGSKNPNEFEYYQLTTGGRPKLKFRELLPPTEKVRLGRHRAPEGPGGGSWGEWGQSAENGIATGQADRSYGNCAWDFVFVGSGPLDASRKVREFRERLSLPSRAIDTADAEVLELYLVYLINQEGENGSLKNIDLSDQKTAPLTPNSLIHNLYPFFQAGRQRCRSGVD